MKSLSTKSVKRFSKNRYVLVFILAIIVAALFSILYNTGLFSDWQHKLTDTLYTEKPVLDDVVIVAIDDKSIQSIGRWPWDRKVFAELIGKLNYTNAIAIDVAFFEHSNNDSDEALERAIKKAGNVILAAEYTGFNTGQNKNTERHLMTPIPQLEKAALSTGYINIITDSDGITRGMQISQDQKYKSFVENMYKEYIGRDFKSNNKNLLINFAGRPGSYRTISIVDVLNKSIPPSFFKDKFVFIGATAPDLHDDYFVPTSRGKAMPGVEIHANALQTMVTKKFLKEQSKTDVILSLFIIALLVAVFMILFRITFSLLSTTALFFIYILVAIYSFNKGVILNIIYPPLTMLFSAFAITGLYYLTEEKKKKEVMHVFGKYVSKNIVDEIFKEEEVIDLKGVEKEITIMFSDIRGFTSMSEKMTPYEVVSVLNRYLGELTDIIFEHGGTLDKYMGDCIMAIFNAPIDMHDPEINACKAALRMQEKIAEINKEKNRNLAMGIGINTGKAVVGNLGGRQRVEYTAIGDTVNLGSRLEGLSKQYNVSIIIGENTYKKVKNEFICRELDLVKVKGKEEAVRIYELRKTKYDKRWDKALKLYRSKRFKEAKLLFNKINDGPSTVFSARCTLLSKKRLPKNWSGVFTATEK